MDLYYTYLYLFPYAYSSCLFCFTLSFLPLSYVVDMLVKDNEGINMIHRK